MTIIEIYLQLTWNTGIHLTIEPTEQLPTRREIPHPKYYIVTTLTPTQIISHIILTNGERASILISNINQALTINQTIQLIFHSGRLLQVGLIQPYSYITADIATTAYRIHQHDIFTIVNNIKTWQQIYSTLSI